MLPFGILPNFGVKSGQAAPALLSRAGDAQLELTAAAVQPGPGEPESEAGHGFAVDHADDWRAPAAVLLTDLAGFVMAYGLLTLLMPAKSAAAPMLAGLTALLVVVLNIRAGLYPGYWLHRHERLRRRVLAALLAAALVMLAEILAAVLGLGAALGLGALHDSPALAVLVLGYLSLAMVLQFGLRRLVRRALHRRGYWGRSMVMLGAEGPSQAASAYFERNWDYGLRPVAALPQGSAAPRLGLLTDGAAGLAASAQLERNFDGLWLAGDLPGLAPNGSEHQRVSARNLSGQILLQLGNAAPASAMAQPHHPAAPQLSGLFDQGLACLMLPIALPIIGLSALALKLLDPGPVFYRQPREGLHGRTIQVLKLRTMYQDADQRLTDLLARDPVASQQWARHFKLQNDPRILPGIGHFLRASSLDELPQLLNVLRRDMGLVGPRPFPGYHLDAMDAGFRRLRCSITPGLTGLWQVSERSTADLQLQCQLDRFYIENRSLWLDLHILLRTVSALFGKSGS